MTKANQPPDIEVLTGRGHAISAWVMTGVFGALALGSLVLAGFSFSNPEQGSSATHNSVAFLILWLVFAATFAGLSFLIFTTAGKKTSMDAQGISGLAIRRKGHKTRPSTGAEDRIAWDDVDHCEVYFAQSGEGGGKYKVRVILIDGQKGVVRASSLRQSSMEELMQRIEEKKRNAVPSEIGPGDGPI
jgi:hypothetical protein